MTIFLDCDGVLADFDGSFAMIFGEAPGTYEAKHGSEKFWGDIAKLDNFFGQLEPMPDMWDLVVGVTFITHDVTILTGTPRGDWAEPQKRAWGKRHLPGIPMVTCLAKNKSMFCKPGDILIDDRTHFAHLWRLAGGTFIHHTSAASSLAQLKGLIDAKV